MGCKTLREFKGKLQETIKSQDISEFKKLLHYCEFQSFYSCDDAPESCCPGCPLSDTSGPEELVCRVSTCLLHSMMRIYWYYTVYDRLTERPALAKLVLEGIKLLAYLESKE